jgi:hypothetical protein
MPSLLKDDAIEIAKKLEKQKSKKSGRESFVIASRNGGKHIIITISYGDKHIAEYGIKRSPDRNAGHDWIPKDMHLTKRQGYEFAKCTLTIDKYIDILIEKDLIDKESQLPSAPEAATDTPEPDNPEPLSEQGTKV